jgi:cell division protein FtsQ
MKKFGQIILWVLVLSGISVILGFALVEQRDVKCTGLIVSISDENPYGFISTKEIEKLVFVEFDSIKGKQVDSLDIELLERHLELNPYIKHANVYTSIHGTLTVEVSREEALIRIINKKNESFYLSQTGKPLPGSHYYTPHVVVASGHISDSYANLKKNDTISLASPKSKKTMLRQLFLLAEALEANQFMSQHIKQIYVNKEGEIELIPDKGGYVILLGDVNDIEIKFENLLVFYQAGMPKVGAENIEVVNLKYINQVVCSK